jgi:hypothetical protein
MNAHTQDASALKKRKFRNKTNVQSPPQSSSCERGDRHWPEDAIEIILILAGGQRGEDFATLSAAAAVCSTWRIVADKLWKSMYQRRWQKGYGKKEGCRDAQWKLLYAERHRTEIRILRHLIRVTRIGDPEEKTVALQGLSDIEHAHFPWSLATLQREIRKHSRLETGAKRAMVDLVARMSTRVSSHARAHDALHHKPLDMKSRPMAITQDNTRENSENSENSDDSSSRNSMAISHSNSEENSGSNSGDENSSNNDGNESEQSSNSTGSGDMRISNSNSDDNSAGSGDDAGEDNSGSLPTEYANSSPSSDSGSSPASYDFPNASPGSSSSNNSHSAGEDSGYRQLGNTPPPSEGPEHGAYLDIPARSTTRSTHDTVSARDGPRARPTHDLIDNKNMRDLIDSKQIAMCNALDTTQLKGITSAMSLLTGSLSSSQEEECNADILMDAACCVALAVDFAADIEGAIVTIKLLGAAAKAYIKRLESQESGMLSTFDQWQALASFVFSPPPEPPVPFSLLETPHRDFYSMNSLGLQGCSHDEYYRLKNSSIVSVLETRKGLPISLSIMHILIGAAAGIRVSPCNMPMQFMTRHPTESLFVDGFAQGRTFDLEGLYKWLASQPGGENLTFEHFEPMVREPSTLTVFARQWANLRLIVLQLPADIFTRLSVLGASIPVMNEMGVSQQLLIEVHQHQMIFALQAGERAMALEHLNLLRSLGGT